MSVSSYNDFGLIGVLSCWAQLVPIISGKQLRNIEIKTVFAYKVVEIYSIGKENKMKTPRYLTCPRYLSGRGGMTGNLRKLRLCHAEVQLVPIISGRHLTDFENKTVFAYKGVEIYSIEKEIE